MNMHKQMLKFIRLLMQLRYNMHKNTILNWSIKNSP